MQQKVRSWLLDHPHFLAEHPEVLENMRLPQDEGNTLSFQAYQNAHLQRRNRELEALFREASRNQKLIDHTLRYAAESSEDRPRSLRQAVETQERRLRRHFPGAGWAIRLRPELPRAPASVCVPEHPPLVRAIMDAHRTGPCILTDREAVALLWPKSRSDMLILAPLSRRKRYGILCRELPPGAPVDGDTALLVHVAAITAAVFARLAPGGVQARTAGRAS